MTEGRKVVEGQWGGKKGWQRGTSNLWNEKNVQQLDYGGGFTGVYTYHNSSHLSFKYVLLILYVMPE